MPWSPGWLTHNQGGRPNEAKQLFREKLLQATRPEVRSPQKEALFEAVSDSLNLRNRTRPFTAVDVFKERLSISDPKIVGLTMELLDHCLLRCGDGPMKELAADRLLPIFIELASRTGKPREMPSHVADQALMLLDKWATKKEISASSPQYKTANIRALELRKSLKESMGPSRSTPPDSSATTSATTTTSHFKPLSSEVPVPSYPAAHHVPPPPDYPAPPTPPSSTKTSPLKFAVDASQSTFNLLTDEDRVDPDISSMLKSTKRMMMEVAIDPRLIGRATHQRWKADYEAEKQRVFQQQAKPPLHAKSPLTNRSYAYYASTTPSIGPHTHQYNSVHGQPHAFVGQQHTSPIYPSVHANYSPVYSTVGPGTSSLPTAYGNTFATVHGKVEPPPYGRITGNAYMKPRGVGTIAKVTDQTIHRRSKSHDMLSIGTFAPEQHNRAGDVINGKSTDTKSSQ